MLPPPPLLVSSTSWSSLEFTEWLIIAIAVTCSILQLYLTGIVTFMMLSATQEEEPNYHPSKSAESIKTSKHLFYQQRVRLKLFLSSFCELPYFSRVVRG